MHKKGYSRARFRGFFADPVIYDFKYPDTQDVATIDIVMVGIRWEESKEGSGFKLYKFVNPFPVIHKGVGDFARLLTVLYQGGQIDKGSLILPGHSLTGEFPGWTVFFRDEQAARRSKSS